MESGVVVDQNDNLSSERLTIFQQEIRDKFYKVISKIPHDKACIKESFVCGYEKCLVFEIVPVSNANCGLNITVHPFSECNMSIEDAGMFEFNEDGDINSWILSLELIWEFIKAVLCGQVEKVSWVRNGKIIQSTINLTVDGKEFGSTAISFLYPIYKLFGMIDKIDQRYEAYLGEDKST